MAGANLAKGGEGGRSLGCCRHRPSEACAYARHRPLATLIGHEEEVSKVAWNAPLLLWVSGSEDHTVRTWSPDGTVLHTVNAYDAVTALCVDTISGFVVVGTMDLVISVHATGIASAAAQSLGQ